MATRQPRMTPAQKKRWREQRNREYALQLLRALMVVPPLLLCANWMWNVLYPHNNYPISDINLRVRLPAIINGSVMSVPIKINTKLLLEVSVYDIRNREFQVSISCDFDLSKSTNTTINIPSFETTVPCSDVRSIEVKLNNEVIPLLMTGEGAEKQYVVPRFTLKSQQSIQSFRLSFHAHKRHANSSGLINVPWLLNHDTYSIVVHMPTLPVIVEKGQKSDAVSLIVHSYDKNYRLFGAGSGWTAKYTTPEVEMIKEYTYTEGRRVRVTKRFEFEYPIDQKVKSIDTTLIFETSLSQDNQADAVTLVFIPSPTILMLPLLVIPFSISSFHLQPRLTRSHRRRWKILGAYVLYVTLLSYPLVFSFDQTISLLREMLHVVGIANILALLSFPVLYGYGDRWLERRRCSHMKR